MDFKLVIFINTRGYETNQENDMLVGETRINPPLPFLESKTTGRPDSVEVR